MTPDRRALPVPLESLVDQGAPAHAPVLWRELTERRLAQRARRGKKRASPMRAALAIAACFLMLLGSALALTLGTRPRVSEERPLLAKDRSALPARLSAHDGYRALDMSDGSRVTVAQGAQLDVLESSPRTVSFALRSGRVRFDVRPRGPRSWRVECGAFSVEVVGTKFVLERGRDSVSVNVLHGAVLVRGASIPDGVQRLEAGRGLRASLRAPAELAVSRRSAPVVLPLAEFRASQRRDKETARALRVASARAARRAKAHGAPGHSEVDALFSAADSARLHGRAQEAASKLSRILTYHADDPRASLAGFALARLELGALAQPARAAGNLKLALSLGLPRALLEDAYGKLVEAYQKAGDKGAACDAFSEYRRRFPHGERASHPPEQCQVDKTQ